MSNKFLNVNHWLHNVNLYKNYICLNSFSLYICNVEHTTKMIFQFFNILTHRAENFCHHCSIVESRPIQLTKLFLFS